MAVNPPFTERWVFSGPNVAISCEVTWDAEDECYVATSSTGFKAKADTQVDAALSCFTAWMTGRLSWFVPK